MSFLPCLPTVTHTHAHPPNHTHKHTSMNGRGLIPSASSSNNHPNSVSTSVIPASTSPSPTPSKSRQKSRSKVHLANTTASHPKSKAKAESKPKGSNSRMRVKRNTLSEAAVTEKAFSDVPGPDSESERGTSAKKPTQVDDCLGDNTEDDETEGEAPNASVDAEANHRTLTVDPFSAEEERIMTVLSRKLEQLRESETTSTPSPLSPIEAFSPSELLPLSPSDDLKAQNQHGQLETLTVATKSTDDGRRVETEPSTASSRGKKKGPSPKRTFPPAISTAMASTLNSRFYKGNDATQVSLSKYAHSGTDSGIYASSPSSTPSSPSSVYAAGTTSPMNYRNGSANPSSAATNAHAVPIAVSGIVTGSGHSNGRSTHVGGSEVVDDGLPFEFNNAHRTYGAISTLSSPEMSLSASPCDINDTRWMGTDVNRNAIGSGVANEKPKCDDLQSNQVQGYEQESARQTQSQLMLQALMQENEQLRSRITDMEGNYLRLARLNEAYREELIGYRTRLGLSVDNLIGLASDPLPASSSFPYPPSTSTYSHTQDAHTYHLQHLGKGLNNNNYTSYIGHNYNINSNTHGNNAYQYHQSSLASATFSDTSSRNQSRNRLNPPSSPITRHKTRESSVASRSGYTLNGFGCENGMSGTENGFVDASAVNGTSESPRNSLAIPSTTTNGVPIPRPPSQVHTNRLKQVPMMMMPMSAPSTDGPLLYMQGSTSRSVNEPASSGPSSSYSSYSGNSPAFFSPSYPSSSSAASSASASTNVTSPPSSFSFVVMPILGVPSRGLSYPLVPPPSLSSSVGSGSASGNLSPVDERRGSLGGGGGWDSLSLRRNRGESLNHGSTQSPASRET